MWTILYPSSIKNMSSLLNSFDENIQFTFESENKGTLPFLDVLICRNGRELMKTNNLHLSLKAKVHYHFQMYYYAETVEN